MQPGSVLRFFSRSSSQPHHSLRNVHQKPDLFYNLESHVLFFLNEFHPGVHWYSDLDPVATE